MNMSAPSRVTHPPHPGVGVEHAWRVIDTANARQDVLVEILLQIDGVAGEHGRAALGKAGDHHLAAGRVRDSAVDIDAVIAEQVEITVELMVLYLLGTLPPTPLRSMAKSSVMKNVRVTTDLLITVTFQFLNVGR
jgi:hypothetical protein